ncbi:unnamed protein product [Paramecium primaurelia]|uniref:Transmembrane protein n=1 Tax=Paramecium primaurelia TaxID=5886 RepID=A0A8S1QVH3_PARPR|nr:unnamed protein product [Paramecium primaurelia]
MTDDFFNLDFEVIAINHRQWHVIQQYSLKQSKDKEEKKSTKNTNQSMNNNLKITKKLREQANRVRGRQKNYGQYMELQLFDKKKEITLNVIAKLLNLCKIMSSQTHQSDKTLQRDSPKNSYLSTLTAFSIILGFALLNGVGLENQQMIQSFQFQSQPLILLNPFIWFTHSSLACVYSLSCPQSVFKKQIKKEKCYLIILQYTHMNLIENNYVHNMLFLHGLINIFSIRKIGFIVNNYEILYQAFDNKRKYDQAFRSKFNHLNYYSVHLQQIFTMILQIFITILTITIEHQHSQEHVRIQSLVVIEDIQKNQRKRHIRSLQLVICLAQLLKIKNIILCHYQGFNQHQLKEYKFFSSFFREIYFDSKDIFEKLSQPYNLDKRMEHLNFVIQLLVLLYFQKLHIIFVQVVIMEYFINSYGIKMFLIHVLNYNRTIPNIQKRKKYETNSIQGCDLTRKNNFQYKNNEEKIKLKIEALVNFQSKRTFDLVSIFAREFDDQEIWMKFSLGLKMNQFKFNQLKFCHSNYTDVLYQIEKLTKTYTQVIKIEFQHQNPQELFQLIKELIEKTKYLDFDLKGIIQIEFWKEYLENLQAKLKRKNLKTQQLQLPIVRKQTHLLCNLHMFKRVILQDYPINNLKHRRLLLCNKFNIRMVILYMKQLFKMGINC